MDVYYINHLNEKILLDSENVILKYQELFNYSWDADTCLLYTSPSPRDA